VTRNIALADETYDALRERKRPGESFSDAVAGLLAFGRPRLADVAGGAADDEHWKEFAAERSGKRRESRGRMA